MRVPDLPWRRSSESLQTCQGGTGRLNRVCVARPLARLARGRAREPISNWVTRRPRLSADHGREPGPGSWPWDLASQATPCEARQGPRSIHGNVSIPLDAMTTRPRALLATHASLSSKALARGLCVASGFLRLLRDPVPERNARLAI